MSFNTTSVFATFSERARLRKGIFMLRHRMTLGYVMNTRKMTTLEPIAILKSSFNKVLVSIVSFSLGSSLSNYKLKLNSLQKQKKITALHLIEESLDENYRDLFFISLFPPFFNSSHLMINNLQNNFFSLVYCTIKLVHFSLILIKNFFPASNEFI